VDGNLAVLDAPGSTGVLALHPVYWRCTPTVAVPFFRPPVSSTTNTASPSSSCSMTKLRRPSRTASASRPRKQML
jgi:hypothetical protein